MWETGIRDAMGKVRPDVRDVHTCVARALGSYVEIAPVNEGVSTYVYRITRNGDTFYLRVLPEEGATVASEVEAHMLLRRCGVHVPEVVYWDDRDPPIGRA